MKSTNPIFICGHPRSGTSITAWCLGQHPNIQYHFEETNIFCLQLEKLFHSPYRLAAVEEYVKYMQTKHLSTKEEAALLLFEEEALCEDELGPVVRRFFDSCMLTEEGCTTFVEKTPLHIFYVDLIRRVYPDAIFLIPRRDRDQVIESMKKKAWSPESEIAREAFYDIIENEIEHCIDIVGLYNSGKLIDYDIASFCVDPNAIISLLVDAGLPKEGFNKVLAAHNERVDLKYLKQPQELDNAQDKEKRMAWMDPNQVNAEATL